MIYQEKTYYLNYFRATQHVLQRNFMSFLHQLPLSINAFSYFTAHLSTVNRQFAPIYRITCGEQALASAQNSNFHSWSNHCANTKQQLPVGEIALCKHKSMFTGQCATIVQAQKCDYESGTNHCSYTKARSRAENHPLCNHNNTVISQDTTFVPLKQPFGSHSLIDASTKHP